MYIKGITLHHLNLIRKVTESSQPTDFISVLDRPKTHIEFIRPVNDHSQTEQYSNNTTILHPRKRLYQSEEHSTKDNDIAIEPSFKKAVFCHQCNLQAINKAVFLKYNTETYKYEENNKLIQILIRICSFSIYFRTQLQYVLHSFVSKNLRRKYVKTTTVDGLFYEVPHDVRAEMVTLKRLIDKGLQFAIATNNSIGHLSRIYKNIEALKKPNLEIDKNRHKINQLYHVKTSKNNENVITFTPETTDVHQSTVTLNEYNTFNETFRRFLRRMNNKSGHGFIFKCFFFPLLDLLHLYNSELVNTFRKHLKPPSYNHALRYKVCYPFTFLHYNPNYLIYWIFDWLLTLSRKGLDKLNIFVSEDDLFPDGTVVNLLIVLFCAVNNNVQLNNILNQNTVVLGMWKTELAKILVTNNNFRTALANVLNEASPHQNKNIPRLFIQNRYVTATDYKEISNIPALHKILSNFFLYCYNCTLQSLNNI